VSLSWARAASAAALLITLAACGGTSINSHPIYILTDDGQHMHLDALSPGTSSIANSISLAAVKSAPPTGGVAIASNGYIVVTNTASFQGSQLAVRPNTQTCRMSTQSCTSLLGNGGSNIIDSLASGFAIPYNIGPDVSHPQVALLTASSPPRVAKTFTLPLGWTPGPIAMNPQGSTAYWIAAKPLTGPNAVPQYQLLEIDLGTGDIRHMVDMGEAYPGAIAVAPSGDLYVAITYAKEAGRTSSAPPTPGTVVEAYTPELVMKATVQVASEPFSLSVSADGTKLAVAYQAPSAARIDLVSLVTLKVTTSVSLPNGASAPSFVSSMANGDFAVVLGGAGFFQLGLVHPTGGNPMWQTYQGNADSAAAG
jgi:hypothetical protein